MRSLGSWTLQVLGPLTMIYSTSRFKNLRSTEELMEAMPASMHEIHHSKPSYGPTLQSASLGGLQPENSSTATSKKSSFPCLQGLQKWSTDISENQVQHPTQQEHPKSPQDQAGLTTNCSEFQQKEATPHTEHSATPHLHRKLHSHTTTITNYTSTEIWQHQHGMQHRTHTRAHWFHTHVKKHQHPGRKRHDLQLASHN